MGTYWILANKSQLYTNFVTRSRNDSLEYFRQTFSTNRPPLFLKFLFDTRYGDSTRIAFRDFTYSTENFTFDKSSPEGHQLYSITSWHKNTMECKLKYFVSTEQTQVFFVNGSDSGVRLIE